MYLKRIIAVTAFGLSLAANPVQAEEAHHNHHDHGHHDHHNHGYVDNKTESYEDSPISIKLGGYLDVAAGFVEEDNDGDLRSHDFRTSTEIHIDVEGKAHGLKYGAHIELEADQGGKQNGDANGDENYIFLQGPWGYTQFGDAEGVSSTHGLFVGAPHEFGLGGAVAHVEEESYFNFITGVGLAGGAPTDIEEEIEPLAESFQPRSSHRSTKISYYSPSFNGFQAGVSYAPQSDNAGQVTARDASGGGHGAVYEDIVELAAKYSGSFNGVDVATAATYNFGDTVTGFDENEELQSVGVGAQISYEGFTIGAAYVNNFDSGLETAEPFDDDAESFQIGIQYQQDAFSVGINYLTAESEGDAGIEGNHDYDAVSAGATYAIAPGLTAYAEATYFQFDGEEVDTATDTDDTDGIVFIIGTRIAF